MKRLVLVGSILFSVFLAVNAVCWIWEGPGKIYFCANLNKTNCDLLQGYALKCYQYNYNTKYPIVSGYTAGDYECRIYEGDKCEGASVLVKQSGLSPFPFSPRSYKCPCV